MAQDRPEVGVQFAAHQGRRSSLRVNQEVFADAVGSVDADLAHRISSAGDWRKSYIGGVRDIVVAGTKMSKDTLRIAADGLSAIRERVVLVEGDEERTLPEELRDAGTTSFRTEEVRGQGTRDKELAVPFEGRLLRGDELRRQLDSWNSSGAIEGSAAEALAEVAGNPDWLDLSDSHFVLLGAASEMGPLESLSRWGANIIAVDLPRPYLWQHILEITRRGSGTMSLPVRGGDFDTSDPSSAGADLLTELRDVRDWLLTFEPTFVIGNYVYADGGDFLRLSAAVDVLISDLLEKRPGTGLAYLATPTDVFMVPDEVVDAARSEARTSPIKSLARGVSGARLYAPNYSNVVSDENGVRWGVSDCLVPIQGANYALAKSIQRWRAMTTSEEGIFTSANVAPASHTRSVVKNRVLAAVYRGARPFGVEIFDAATSRVVMGALLVHDLRSRAGSGTSAAKRHPVELFVDKAVHGGIWRLPYEPRSVLPLALVTGMLKRS